MTDINPAIKAALPYAVVLVASTAAGAILHTPDLNALPVLTAGALAGVGGRRAWESLEFRRGGGNAHARQRRRYQGTATRAEVRTVLSARAVRRRAKVTRPSLAGAVLPEVTEAGIPLGARSKRELYGSLEDFYAIFCMARGGKTGALSGMLHSFPGPALVTSTRTDIRRHTVSARRDLAEQYGGQVLTLNPGGDGMIPSDFACSPLQGCRSFPQATSSAGYLMAAAPKDPGGSDAWIDAEGGQLLRVMMHAAALAGEDMLAVLDWVRHPHCAAAGVLETAPAADPEAARSLASLLAKDSGSYLQSVIATAESALSWLADPAMRRAACPPDGAGLTADAFLDGRSTIYLIGGGRKYDPLTRYFAWVNGWLYDQSKYRASMMPGGRLDPPLGMVIDEPALIPRVPLDQWSAEAGGHGITVMTGFQSFAQLSQGWGAEGGQVIFDNAVKLIMGGYTAGDALERISAACGERDTWHYVTGPGGRTRQPHRERLFPPERIRNLKPGRALLLYRSVRPVVIRTKPVWELAAYQPEEVPAAAARRAMPAIEAVTVPEIAPVRS